MDINIKNKTINLELKWKHLWFFLAGVFLFSLLMNLYPGFFGLYKYQYIGCTDGTILPIVANETIYCGQNISEMGYTLIEGVWKK